MEDAAVEVELKILIDPEGELPGGRTTPDEANVIAAAAHEALGVVLSGS